MRNLRLSPILLALIAAPACSDNNSSTSDVGDTAVSDGEDLGNAHADDTDSELANDSTDERLAKAGAIVISIDQAEIDQANFALDTAVDVDVLDFASEMLDVHTAHITATEQFLAGAGLDPLPNVISDDLDVEASNALDDLTRSNDVDFDYMVLQVQQHAEAFIIVSELSDLQDNDVDARFFDDTAATIADHRDHAQVILRGL